MNKLLIALLVAATIPTAYAGDLNDVEVAHERITAVQETLYQEGLIRAQNDKVYHESTKKADKVIVENQMVVDKNQDVRITNNTSDIASNTQQINVNTGRINHLEGRIDSIEERVDTLEEAFSMQAAMTNLTDDDLSAAVGYYEGNVSFAVGINKEVNDNVSVKVSAATNFDTVMFGAGVGFNF